MTPPKPPQNTGSTVDRIQTTPKTENEKNILDILSKKRSTPPHRTSITSPEEALKALKTRSLGNMPDIETQIERELNPALKLTEFFRHSLDQFESLNPRLSNLMFTGKVAEILDLIRAGKKDDVDQTLNYLVDNYLLEQPLTVLRILFSIAQKHKDYKFKATNSEQEISLKDFSKTLSDIFKRQSIELGMSPRDFDQAEASKSWRYSEELKDTHIYKLGYERKELEKIRAKQIPNAESIIRDFKILLPRFEAAGTETSIIPVLMKGLGRLMHPKSPIYNPQEASKVIDFILGLPEDFATDHQMTILHRLTTYKESFPNFKTSNGEALYQRAWGKICQLSEVSRGKHGEALKSKYYNKFKKQGLVKHRKISREPVKSIRENTPVLKVETSQERASRLLSALLDNNYGLAAIPLKEDSSKETLDYTIRFSRNIASELIDWKDEAQARRDLSLISDAYSKLYPLHAAAFLYTIAADRPEFTVLVNYKAKQILSHAAQSISKLDNSSIKEMLRIKLIKEAFKGINTPGRTLYSDLGIVKQKQTETEESILAAKNTELFKSLQGSLSSIELDVKNINFQQFREASFAIKEKILPFFDDLKDEGSLSKYYINSVLREYKKSHPLKAALVLTEISELDPTFKIEYQAAATRLETHAASAVYDLEDSAYKVALKLRLLSINNRHRVRSTRRFLEKTRVQTTDLGKLKDEIYGFVDATDGSFDTRSYESKEYRSLRIGLNEFKTEAQELKRLIKNFKPINLPRRKSARDNICHFASSSLVNFCSKANGLLSFSKDQEKAQELEEELREISSNLQTATRLAYLGPVHAGRAEKLIQDNLPKLAKKIEEIISHSQYTLSITATEDSEKVSLANSVDQDTLVESKLKIASTARTVERKIRSRTGNSLSSGTSLALTKLERAIRSQMALSFNSGQNEDLKNLSKLHAQVNAMIILTRQIETELSDEEKTNSPAAIAFEKASESFLKDLDETKLADKDQEKVISDSTVKLDSPNLRGPAALIKASAPTISLIKDFSSIYASILQILNNEEDFTKLKSEVQKLDAKIASLTKLFEKLKSQGFNSEIIDELERRFNHLLSPDLILIKNALVDKDPKTRLKKLANNFNNQHRAIVEKLFPSLLKALKIEIDPRSTEEANRKGASLHSEFDKLFNTLSEFSKAKIDKNTLENFVEASKQAMQGVKNQTYNLNRSLINKQNLVRLDQAGKELSSNFTLIKSQLNNLLYEINTVIDEIHAHGADKNNEIPVLLSQLNETSSRYINTAIKLQNVLEQSPSIEEEKVLEESHPEEEIEVQNFKNPELAKELLNKLRDTLNIFNSSIVPKIIKPASKKKLDFARRNLQSNNDSIRAFLRSSKEFKKAYSKLIKEGEEFNTKDLDQSLNTLVNAIEIRLEEIEKTVNDFQNGRGLSGSNTKAKVGEHSREINKVYKKAIRPLSKLVDEIKQRLGAIEETETISESPKTIVSTRFSGSMITVNNSRAFDLVPPKAYRNKKSAQLAENFKKLEAAIHSIANGLDNSLPSEELRRLSIIASSLAEQPISKAAEKGAIEERESKILRKKLRKAISEATNDMSRAIHRNDIPAAQRAKIETKKLLAEMKRLTVDLIRTWGNKVRESYLEDPQTVKSQERKGEEYSGRASDIFSKIYNIQRILDKKLSAHEEETNPDSIITEATFLLRGMRVKISDLIRPNQGRKKEKGLIVRFQEEYPIVNSEARKAASELFIKIIEGRINNDIYRLKHAIVNLKQNNNEAQLEKIKSISTLIKEDLADIAKSLKIFRAELEALNNRDFINSNNQE